LTPDTPRRPLGDDWQLYTQISEFVKKMNALIALGVGGLYSVFCHGRACAGHLPWRVSSERRAKEVIGLSLQPHARVEKEACFLFFSP
jgi:hypothetical protein